MIYAFTKIDKPVVGKSVDFLRLRNPLVDWLATGETLIRAMPVSDGFLAEFPAQQDGSSVDLARKIKKTNVEIFDLHADGINFGQRIFHSLFRLRALGLAPGEGNDVEEHSAGQKNPM